MSIFAGAQVASAQNAVSEEEIKCFVSGCDEAKASDEAEAKAGDDDECMTSGICPVGETRGFHLSTGAPAKQAATKPGGSAARPAAPRYAASTGGKVAGKVAGASRLAMPATRKSLDMRLSFETASATLTPAARAQADAFARQIKDAAGTRQFVIEGHTDNVGSAAYNRQLSRERAQSVVSYLVGQGVPAGKLRAVGYGFDHPRDGTTAADASNRRVEIVRY
ncbi:OmpA family protein [Novosphingobium resinovorum]|uniref:OmpA family protein n=1 Tax=Novosphingobium resinovorum TaxID=158500 RepID=UPI002ED51270|nr:OmpA family protein [Novosphingobium resinovorum]